MVPRSGAGRATARGWRELPGGDDLRSIRGRELRRLHPQTGTLKVSAAGSGSGSITGPGIDCPGDCSETYANGANVTLNARRKRFLVRGLVGRLLGGWRELPDGDRGDASASAAFDPSEASRPSTELAAPFHTPPVPTDTELVSEFVPDRPTTHELGSAGANNAGAAGTPWTGRTPSISRRPRIPSTRFTRLVGPTRRRGPANPGRRGRSAAGGDDASFSVVEHGRLEYDFWRPRPRAATAEPSPRIWRSARRGTATAWVPAARRIGRHHRRFGILETRPVCDPGVGDEGGRDQPRAVHERPWARRGGLALVTRSAPHGEWSDPTNPGDGTALLARHDAGSDRRPLGPGVAEDHPARDGRGTGCTSAMTAGRRGRFSSSPATTTRASEKGPTWSRLLTVARDHGLLQLVDRPHGLLLRPQERGRLGHKLKVLEPGQSRSEPCKTRLREDAAQGRGSVSARLLVVRLRVATLLNSYSPTVTLRPVRVSRWSPRGGVGGRGCLIKGRRRVDERSVETLRDRKTRVAR